MDKEQISSPNLSKEIAYLFGVYLTDGSIVVSESSFKNSKKKYISSHFTLKAIDEDFVKLTLDFLKIIIPSCRANVWTCEPKDRYWKDGTVSKCQKQYCIGVGFTKWYKFFQEQTGFKHHIPYLMWNAPITIKKWFIAGVMDGDGYISITNRKDYKDYWNSKCERKQFNIGVGKLEESWIYEFRELLQKMGIKVLKNKRIIKDSRGYRKPFVSFRINVSSFIEHGLFFTIKRKQDKVKLLREVQRLNAAHPTG